MTGRHGTTHHALTGRLQPCCLGGLLQAAKAWSPLDTLSTAALGNLQGMSRWGYGERSKGRVQATGGCKQQKEEEVQVIGCEGGGKGAREGQRAIRKQKENQEGGGREGGARKRGSRPVPSLPAG